MPESSSDTPVQHVTEDEIRRLFNESEVPAMIAGGQLQPQVLYDTELSQEACLRLGQPAGTRSQFLRYFNARRRWVVEVHQYLRPDGFLGASGHPDPKRLRLNRKIYVKDA